MTDAYLYNFKSVSHLYDEQDPTDELTFKRRADQISPLFDDNHRKQLVDALIAYNQQVGATDVQLASVHRLMDPRSVAVVTGQQSGLLTGPFYSVSKALSAIGIAAEMERVLERPVVPVFWIASEDHDFAEVDHAYVIGRDDKPTRIALDHDFDGHRMVYHAPLRKEQVVDVIERVQGVLPEAPYKVELLHTLHDAWRDGDSLAMWFARLMSRLLASHPIVFLDPCLPELRSLVAPAFEHTLAHVDELQLRLTEAYRAVEEAGFSPEVIRDEQHTTVFRVAEGRRYVIERAGDGEYRTRGHGETHPLSEWLRCCRETPTGFSSNVLLRPVIQDHLLPTLAYVGGASELAYHALSRAVFHTHNRTLPPLIMRQRLRIASPGVWRTMAAWNIEFDHVRTAADLVATHALGDLSDSLQSDLDAFTQALEEHMKHVSSTYEYLGPQVHDIVHRHEQRGRELVDGLHRKIYTLAERRRHDDVQQLRRIETWFWTDGHDQERRLSPMNLWAELGLQWFQQLPAWGNFRQPGAVLECVAE